MPTVLTILRVDTLTKAVVVNIEFSTENTKRNKNGNEKIEEASKI